ncbi:MAG: diguanylate cyclase [Candidatus Omnitrophica bacterium]|nr:diguanylate cyclase [Candidatus Omnitrophota bacterium]
MSPLFKKISSLKNARIHPLRDAILTFMILFSVVLLGTGLLYYKSQVTYKQLIHQNILRIAKAAASLVDGDVHKTFTTPEQENTEAYKRAIQPLRSILLSLESLKFVYTVILADGQVHFILDGTPPGDADQDGVEDHSAIMEIYEEYDPALMEALTKNIANTSKEPITDKWGTFISANAPIYDASKKPVGILGVDVDYTEYAQKLLMLKLVTLSGLIPAFIICVTAGFVIHWVRKKSLFYDLEKRKNLEALQISNEKMTVAIQELEESTREANLLNEMGGVLQSCINLGEVYQEVSRSMEKILPESKGALYVSKTTNNIFESVSSWSQYQGKESFVTEECWALRRGQMLEQGEEKDAGGQPRCKHVLEQAAGISLCIPIVAQGETLGLLYIKLAQDKLTPSKKRLISTATEQISLAIANIKLRQILHDQSILDSLSGLYNRRHMEELLEREVQIAKRKQHSVGVIMFDINGFKKYNDTLGHEAGDLLIKTIGQYLKNHVREYDIPCRFGGDEFMVILPESSLEVVQKRAQELQEGFKQIQLHYRGKLIENVTLSRGIAVYPQHGILPHELLRYADEALYKAKSECRI